MKPEQAACALDILVAAREAVDLAQHLTYEYFAGDRRTQLSIVKSIENIGEAAARVDEEVRRAHPGIAWQDIVGMRDRQARGYFDIDPRLVWDTVRADLPKLIVRLQRLLASAGQ